MNELQSALELSAQASGQLFWLRQDIPIESLLPPKRKSDARDWRGPKARADNFRATGGYGYVTLPGGIAIFNINGVIAPAAYASYEDDSMTVSDLLAADVRAATNDPAVTGAMFVINSPGGYVAGSYELAETISALNQAKPTASFVVSLAASAAYLQAAMTGAITAYKTAYVGSIGTRSVLVDASGLFETAGVKIIPIDSGGMKSAGLMGTRITDEQKAYFQNLIDQSNAFFVSAVAEGRKISASQAQALADGRVHLAADAKSNQLIDAVGSFAQAMVRLQAATPSGAIQRPTTRPKNEVINIEPSAISDPASVISDSQSNQNQTAEAAQTDPEASASDARAGADAGLFKELPMNGTQANPAGNSTATVVSPAAAAAQTATATQSAVAHAASMAELKAACPGAPADFLVEQSEKSASIDQAVRNYVAFQNAQIRARDEELTKLKSAAATAAVDVQTVPAAQTQTRKPGVPALAENSAGNATGTAGSSASALAQLREIVEAKVKTGMDRSRATSLAIRENPELQQAAIAEETDRTTRRRSLIKQAAAV